MGGGGGEGACSAETLYFFFGITSFFYHDKVLAIFNFSGNCDVTRIN